MIRQIILLAAAASTVAAASAQGKKANAPAKEVRFLEDIEVSFGTDNGKVAESSKPVSKQAASTQAAYKPGAAGAAETKGPVAGAGNNVGSNSVRGTLIPQLHTVKIEDAGSLHLKFALLLNVDVEQVPALPLLLMMDDWWGTKYRLGGQDRSGIDCSGFTGMLYSSLYHIQLPRSSREQYQAAKSIDPAQLREGDLVFFAHDGAISHVGFYLQNNKFVHASTSEGVTISDLNDRYWQQRFAGAGRL